jgi:quinolinate synthase
MTPIPEAPPAVPADPAVIAEIEQLREDLNAVILAHFYQEPAIQDLADHVGDSLFLAQRAAETEAEVIVFAGVHFMAETAKILNPDKLVLVPDLDAGCSLADGCPADEFSAWLKNYPDHKVISYINCSAATKALSDMICTSSNAVKVVESFPADQPLVFAPDRFLGRWVGEQTGRDLVLWDGSCEVHEVFSAIRLEELREEHPDAVVAAHPECPGVILDQADHVGSTSSILAFARTTPAEKIIVVTEPGIIHQMQKENPGKVLIPAPGADESCSCNLCPYMRKNTIPKLRDCMKHRTPELILDPDLAERALLPLQRMLDISR